MKITKCLKSMLIVSILSVLSVTGHAQSSQPRNLYQDGASTGNSAVEEIKKRHIPGYTTDSTKANWKEDHTTMQSLSGAIQADTVGIYGFEDANNFITNPANRCTPGTKLPVCFTRVSVSSVGAKKVDGGGSCPEDYETLMNYGTGIVLAGTNDMLYYYQADAHPYTSNEQWNWYWSEGYRLETCPAWNRWTVTWEQDGVDRNYDPRYAPWMTCTNCDNEATPYVGPLKKAGWVENFTFTKRCYTRPRVGASCGTAVVGNRAIYTYYVSFLCRNIVRDEGYYKPPKNSLYPVGPQVGGISPTIRICGRKINVWRPYEN